MLTREEQIMKLEEAFNRLVIEIADHVGNDSYTIETNQLQAVTAALTYLRTVIPNPNGKVDPSLPRKRELHL